SADWSYHELPELCSTLEPVTCPSRAISKRTTTLRPGPVVRVGWTHFSVTFRWTCWRDHVNGKLETSRESEAQPAGEPSGRPRGTGGTAVRASEDVPGFSLGVGAAAGAERRSAAAIRGGSSFSPGRGRAPGRLGLGGRGWGSGGAPGLGGGGTSPATGSGAGRWVFEMVGRGGRLGSVLRLVGEP